MKQSTRTPGAPAPCPKSHARLPWDQAELTLPDGRTLGALGPAELKRALRRLGIPHPANGGLSALADAYAAFLDDIGQAAADAEISAWLRYRGAE